MIRSIVRWLTIGQLQADDHSFFFLQDADGSVPFFWGTDSEGHLVLSEDAEIIKKGCGNSFAPFPKGIEQRNCGAQYIPSVHNVPVYHSFFCSAFAGCFFTTSGGLQSFEHPLNEVKPMPRVDSQGQVCGATFKVDADSKKDSGMPRVGSAANWSSHYWSNHTTTWRIQASLWPFVISISSSYWNFRHSYVCGSYGFVALVKNHMKPLCFDAGPLWPLLNLIYCILCHCVEELIDMSLQLDPLVWPLGQWIRQRC